LHKALALWHSSATPFALALFDINKFSQINHTWGYEIVDRVLLAVAQMLREGKQRRVQLYRMPGDVFALLMPIYSVRQGKLLQRLSRDLLQKLRQPLHIEPHRLYLSANVGISQNAEALNTSPETLLRDCDRRYTTCPHRAVASDRLRRTHRPAQRPFVAHSGNAADRDADVVLPGVVDD